MMGSADTLHAHRQENPRALAGIIRRDDVTPRQQPLRQRMLGTRSLLVLANRGLHRCVDQPANGGRLLRPEQQPARSQLVNASARIEVRV